MKTYRIKLVKEEVEVTDTVEGHAKQANDAIFSLEIRIRMVNALVEWAVRNTNEIKMKEKRNDSSTSKF